MATELAIALDYSDPEKAEALIDQLLGLPVIYKVGLELFMSAGGAWVQSLTASGERIFLDLKFHDIPNTVSQATLQAAKLGVEFVTVHLSGGKRMLDEIDFRLQEAERNGEIVRRPNVLGVSVLTSFHEEEWVMNVSRIAKVTSARSIQDSVMHYADLAWNHAGVQGMVCSPKEVEMVRFKYPDLYLMVPGIRFEGASVNDQVRIMTPAQAKQAGASAIVVGRPITQSDTPRKVVETILGDLS